MMALAVPGDKDRCGHATSRAVNRGALGTGVDGEAAVTAGHRPECINVPNWAWREATSDGRARPVAEQGPGSKVRFPCFWRLVTSALTL